MMLKNVQNMREEFLKELGSKMIPELLKEEDNYQRHSKLIALKRFIRAHTRLSVEDLNNSFSLTKYFKDIKEEDIAGKKRISLYELASLEQSEKYDLFEDLYYISEDQVKGAESVYDDLMDELDQYAHDIATTILDAVPEEKLNNSTRNLLECCMKRGLYVDADFRMDLVDAIFEHPKMKANTLGSLDLFLELWRSNNYFIDIDHLYNKHIKSELGIEFNAKTYTIHGGHHNDHTIHMIFTNRKSDENGLPKAFTALSPHIDRVAVWPSIVSVAEFSAEKLMNDLKGQFNIKADQEKDWMRGLNRIESNIGFLCSDTLKAEYISDRAKDILKEEMKNSGSFAYALNQIESRPVKTPKP